MKRRLVGDMLEENNQAAEQIRQLRQAEQDKADQQLQAKMDKKKVGILHAKHTQCVVPHDCSMYVVLSLLQLYT